MHPYTKDYYLIIKENCTIRQKIGNFNIHAFLSDHHLLFDILLNNL